MTTPNIYNNLPTYLIGGFQWTNVERNSNENLNLLYHQLVHKLKVLRSFYNELNAADPASSKFEGHGFEHNFLSNEECRLDRFEKDLVQGSLKADDLEASFLEQLILSQNYFRRIEC